MIARRAAAGFLATLVLLPLAALTAVPQGAPPGASAYAPVTDKPGDVVVFGLPSPVGLTSTPATAPFDLTEMGITDEDEVGLRFYLKVVSLNGDLNELSSPDAQFNLWATLEGSKQSYRVVWYPSLPGPLAPQTGMESVSAELCSFPEDSGQGGFPFGACVDVEGTIDYDTGTLNAYVTKDAIMFGSGPSDGTHAAPGLKAGSRLKDLYAESRGYSLPPWSDRLPDDGSAPPYTFVAPAANTRLRLLLDTGVDATEVGATGGPTPTGGPPAPDVIVAAPAPSTDVSVTPGQPTLVRLRIQNDNAVKRLVNLTATLDKDAPKNKWAVEILPALRVPAGTSRVVNLIVNATTKLEHRERTTVVVRGESLGVPDEIAALRLHLIASVPPGPTRSTLYLHAAEASSQGALDLTPVCRPLGCGRSGPTWINTLKDDPLADLDAAVPMEQRGFTSGGGSTYRIEFALDAPISDALILDPATPVTATLSFRTSVDFTGQVDIEAYTVGTNRALGGGSISSPIKTGTPVTVTFLPLADQNRVGPEDGPLAILIEVRTPLAGPGAATLPTGLDLVARESDVVMPFLPDPDAGRVILSAGPAFLSLSAQTDAEEFLNPGRAKIFNATVVNEGVEADEAKLEVLYDDPDWKVDLFPGARFNLPAGDSALFALLVHAPADAKDGDQLHVLVNATSGADPAALSQLAFTAIVTTTIDLPDESAFYATDLDSAEKVVKSQGKDTPGFEAVLVVAALVLLGRRFRGRPG